MSCARKGSAGRRRRPGRDRNSDSDRPKASGSVSVVSAAVSVVSAARLLLLSHRRRGTDRTTATAIVSPARQPAEPGLRAAGIETHCRLRVTGNLRPSHWQACSRGSPSLSLV